MQIKTEKRYHLIPGRMAVIKKTRNTKCGRKWGKIRTLLVGMEIGSTTMETSMEILQKVETRTTV